MIPIDPEREAARLATLRSLARPGDPPDPQLDRIARLAAQICGTPVALVTMVDADRQWFRARVGTEAEGTPREHAFCAHTIGVASELFVVPDAAADVRFATNPVVAGPPHIRFYAGAKLLTSSGDALGSLCVMDVVPRQLDDAQHEALATLARHVVVHLELAQRVRDIGLLAERDREAREAAAFQNAKLTAILDTSVTGIVEVDPAGRITFANLQAERVLGLRRSSLTGRSYDEPSWRHTALDGGPWPDEAQPFVRVLKTGRPVFDVRHSIVHPDGRRHALSINGAPVFGPGGEVASVVFTVADITERLNEESARARSEAQRAHSSKLEALGTLAGGVAHDFNNLLAGMLANAAFLRTALPGTGEALEAMNDLERAGWRARDLVRQILTFGRREPSTRRVIDVTPVVDEAVRTLRATMPSEAQFVFEPPSGGLRASCDPGQLHQVVVNLVANARQALRGGRGRVVVGLRRTRLHEPNDVGLPDGPYVHLTVEDDGIGMDPVTIERAFEPFFTTKPVGEGSGLGLSVVDGIVRGHGGACRIDSGRGAGTNVHVYLPEVEAAERPAVAGSWGVPGTEPPRGLPVDDEP